ncbi:MAG TPA: aminopeptidase P family N-terminal domain-containing protein, partial [Nitrolancea sp.]|nr:aminopeptidase P family N-terminal domain-containing protein [Nitrolancea sp.]
MAIIMGMIVTPDRYAKGEGSLGTSESIMPTKSEIAGRLEKVASIAKEQGIDSVVVLEPAHIFYLSGFRTTLYTRFMGVALRTEAPQEAMLIATAVDKRLTEQPVWYPSLLD